MHDQVVNQIIVAKAIAGCEPIENNVRSDRKRGNMRPTIAVGCPHSFKEMVQSIRRKVSAAYRDPFAYAPHFSNRWPWLGPIWVRTLQLQHVDILAAFPDDTALLSKSFGRCGVTNATIGV